MHNGVLPSEYLTNSYNYKCYKYLTEGELKGYFDPTEFIEVLNECYAIIIAQRLNPFKALLKLKERLNDYSDEESIIIRVQLHEKLRIELEEFYFKGSEQIEICLFMLADDLRKLIPPEPATEEEEIVFDWKETKKEVDNLIDTDEKISYLIEASTNYKLAMVDNKHLSPSFLTKCEILIDKIKTQKELNTLKTPYKDKLRLSSTKKGAKIDFLRIVNALYLERFFITSDDSIPSKATVMQAFGELVGLDLSSYNTDLSQSFNNVSAEANVSIFETMKKVTQNEVLNRDNCRK